MTTIPGPVEPASLRQRAKEAADKAQCARCAVVILSDVSAVGAMTGLDRVPALGVNTHFALCGNCGLDLREWMFPAAAKTAGFQYVARELRRMWGRR